MLDSVLESDDEQADALSPDQIRRYLDESRARGEARRRRVVAHPGSDEDSDDSSCRQENVGERELAPPEWRGRQSLGREKLVDDVEHETSRGPELLQMDGPSSGRSCSSGAATASTSAAPSLPLVDEYDDLFDEDFEDELDSVVVGAKFPNFALGHGVVAAVASAASPRQDDSEAGSELIGTSASGVEVRNRRLDAGSLVDWIDMGDEEPAKELLGFAQPPVPPLPSKEDNLLIVVPPTHGATSAYASPGAAIETSCAADVAGVGDAPWSSPQQLSAEA